MTNPLDLEALKAKAKAMPTVAPWRVSAEVYVEDGQERDVVQVDPYWTSDSKRAITAYIAAANPTVVLSLIERIETLTEVLELSDIGQRDCIKDPRDPEIRELCERHGYGAVMDSAARQWRKKDPNGALTVGACVVTIREALKAGEEK